MRLIINFPDIKGDSIPMYMVGLPEDPFEAEATRDKFTRVVNLLRKSYPDITEARAVIKAGKTKASKTRYEVQILVKTPRKQFNYEGFGFELPGVFDGISAWSKRQVGRDNGRRGRVRSDPGTIA
jgi:hypothetical protein